MPPAAQQQTLPGFVTSATDGSLTLDERFEIFHRDNPWVADALERLADELVDAGVTRIGVKALVERLRWDWTVQTRSRDWKLNNSLTSRYARLLCERRPDLAKKIERRRLRS